MKIYTQYTPSDDYSIFDSLTTPNRWRHYGQGFLSLLSLSQNSREQYDMELSFTSKKPRMI